MVPAFYTAYFLGLICLYAVLRYTFGVRIALLLFGAMKEPDQLAKEQKTSRQFPIGYGKESRLRSSQAKA
jgi:hypothetical protein